MARERSQLNHRLAAVVERERTVAAQQHELEQHSARLVVLEQELDAIRGQADSHVELTQSIDRLETQLADKERLIQELSAHSARAAAGSDWEQMYKELSVEHNDLLVLLGYEAVEKEELRVNLDALQAMLAAIRAAEAEESAPSVVVPSDSQLPSHAASAADLYATGSGGAVGDESVVGAHPVAVAVAVAVAVSPPSANEPSPLSNGVLHEESASLAIRDGASSSAGGVLTEAGRAEEARVLVSEAGEEEQLNNYFAGSSDGFDFLSSGNDALAGASLPAAASADADHVGVGFASPSVAEPRGKSGFTKGPFSLFSSATELLGFGGPRA